MSMSSHYLYDYSGINVWKKIVKKEASVERVFSRHKLIVSPLIHLEKSLSHETDLLDFSSLFEQNVENFFSFRNRIAKP